MIPNRIKMKELKEVFYEKNLNNFIIKNNYFVYLNIMIWLLY